MHYPCLLWTQLHREVTRRKKPTNVACTSTFVCVCGDKRRKASKGRSDKKLVRPLLPSLSCSFIHPYHRIDGAHAQHGRSRGLLRRGSREARRPAELSPWHHHRHHPSSEHSEGGGDGGHAGRLRRAGPVPGGDRERVGGEDAGQRGHAPPHPHPDPLRALPLPRAPRPGAGGARRGGRAQAPPQDRRLADPLPQDPRQRRGVPQAGVRVEGQGPGLRRGAHRQDRQGARRRRPRPRLAPLRAAQPSQSAALLPLTRWPERERLHHRCQDRPDQDAGPYPQEEKLGVNSCYLVLPFFFPADTREEKSFLAVLFHETKTTFVLAV